MARRNERFAHANRLGALFITGEPECFPLYQGRKQIIRRITSTI
jgi:hypothetical protein